MMDNEDAVNILTSIGANMDWSRMIRTSSHPAFGQFVITGPNSLPVSNRVGFCVQVRRKVGQFGSDMVILRHADGSLCIHENNCYVALTEEQEELARGVFKVLPEDESSESEYGANGVWETGFVIENSETKGTPDVPFVIAITTEK
ncbi:plasmid protein [Proteus mirabilis]|nr:plasmid protein [Proteus mirabilis]